MLLAGEASGDAHGAEVARELRRTWPSCELVGMGGPEMASAGVTLSAELDDLAVMGFVEVIRHLGFFRRLFRTLEAKLESGTIDLVVAVDYPGFNLRFATRAHELGVPVLFYIAPQVWAWREGRAAKLARVADRVAVILPFEVPLLQSYGANVHFVGHPLVEPAEPAPWIHLHGPEVDPSRPVVALLPGSRRQEIKRHLAVMVEAAARIRTERPDAQVCLAWAETLASPSGPALSHTPAGTWPEWMTVVQGSRSLLAVADAGLVKSGTSTLESALAGMPFVCMYRTHPLTWLLAQRLVQVDHVALANLVADERVVPELLQDEATPERLASALLPLLDADSPVRAAQLDGFARVRERLGTPGAAGRVAVLAAEILEERASPTAGHSDR